MLYLFDNDVMSLFCAHVLHCIICHCCVYVNGNYLLQTNWFSTRYDNYQLLSRNIEYLFECGKCCICSRKYFLWSKLSRKMLYKIGSFLIWIPVTTLYS